jgi:hypothetical protein
MFASRIVLVHFTVSLFTKPANRSALAGRGS